MDFFHTISFAPPTPSIPQEEDKGSGGTGGYCVVFNNEVPSDEDKGSGGTGGYCIIS